MFGFLNKVGKLDFILDLKLRILFDSQNGRSDFTESLPLPILLAEKDGVSVIVEAVVANDDCVELRRLRCAVVLVESKPGSANKIVALEALMALDRQVFEDPVNEAGCLGLRNGELVFLDSICLGGEFGSFVNPLEELGVANKLISPQLSRKAWILITPLTSPLMQRLHAVTVRYVRGLLQYKTIMKFRIFVYMVGVLEGFSPKNSGRFCFSILWIELKLNHFA